MKSIHIQFEKLEFGTRLYVPFLIINQETNEIEYQSPSII